MAQLAGTPVLILKEDTQRRKGRDALTNNVAASLAVAEAVRTTLGPKGMDKMIVDSLGDITITNDGASILDEIDVEHPAAKMMVEVAKTQDDKVGDGTTTAVVVGGELLRGALDLHRDSVHPTVIVRGYRKALLKCLELLDELAEPVDPSDDEVLLKAARTAMNSKNVASTRDLFAKMAVDAVKKIKDEVAGRPRVDLDHVQVIKKEGKSLQDTEFINGMIVDKEVVHPLMPKVVKDVKIALVDCALEVEKTEFDSEIRVSRPEEMELFIKEEEKMLRDMVDRIVEAGATVVFCQKGIDDLAQHFLAKKGVMAIRRVKRSDMEKLARATGGKIVNNLQDLTAEDLGAAERVEERKVAKDKMIFVEGCSNPRAVSVLLRGGTEHVVAEAERTLHDALCVVKSLIEVPAVVTGGGATTVELAKRLRTYAGEIGGREQLAIEQFAEALEIVPKTLAENAGHDPMDVLVELRASHEKEGGKHLGVDLATGKVADLHSQGVIQPKMVLKQAITSATEVASLVLRIDDVIAASKSKGGGEGPEVPSGESDDLD
ncbi:MAG: thermosome subunit beta [Promethearchaeota archaeon]